MTLDLAEQSIKDYNFALEQGQISKDEYVSLMKGLEVEKVATMNAEEMQKKEELNNYINAAISAVSLVA